jgi:hypothetical protein
MYAAGMTLKEENYSIFKEAFENKCRKRSSGYVDS